MVDGKPDASLDWLDDLSDDVHAAIAYRTALRCLPYAFQPAISKATERNPLGILRTVLTAGVAINCDAELPLDGLSKMASDFASNSGGLSDESDVVGHLFSDLFGLVVASFSAAMLAGIAMDSENALETINRAYHQNRTGYDRDADYRLSKIAALKRALLETGGYVDGYPDQALDAADVLNGPVQPASPVTKRQQENLRTGLELLHSSGPWTFWAKWYDRAMAGEPLPWDLQEQIALIPDEIWATGPEAVADEIARIEAKFELQQRISEFETDQALTEESRLGIGGNHPPEEINDPEVAERVVILWESIAGLKQEVEADEPNATRVAHLIEQLGAALRAVLAWCARKGDLAVDTTIKCIIPGGLTGYLVLNPAKAEAILKAAQAWLPFLAP